MTINEFIGYFKTGYAFRKATGMSHNNFTRWKKQGYVPILAQIIIEKKTSGALKANLEHTTEGSGE